jgi:hypothetical protein
MARVSVLAGAARVFSYAWLLLWLRQGFAQGGDGFHFAVVQRLQRLLRGLS